MTWLLAALTAIVFVEVLLCLPLLPMVRRLLGTARQVSRVIVSPRISDHWKEKTLVVYAGRLLRQSLLVSGLLFVACVAAMTAAFALMWAFNSDLPSFFLTVEGTAFATIVSFAYVFIRSRLDRFRLVPRQL